MPTKKTYPQSVDDLDFYFLSGFDPLKWAIAVYDQSSLIILLLESSETSESFPEKPEREYVWFEASLADVQSGERLLETVQLVTREAWRLTSMGFSTRSVNEDEMNSVLLRYANPTLFFI